MPETFFQLPTPPKVTHPETKPATRIEVVDPARDMASFQRVPELVHWGDPFWIEPILSEERALFGRETPFARRGGEARLFTAWHGHGQPVGRIAAFRDPAYDAAAGARHGFFGFYDYMNDARLPEALLAVAVSWLRERGAERITGPFSFTPWRSERGHLVEGFYDEPLHGTAYSPPSYPGFAAKAGLMPWRLEHAYALDPTQPPPETLGAKAKEVAARDGLTVRPWDLARLDAEWDRYVTLREACRGGGDPAVPPMPRDEADLWKPMAAKLLRLFPGGGLFLEARGEAVGAALALPDWNRVVKHMDGMLLPIGWLKAKLLERSIDRARVHALFVAEAGKGRGLVLAHALWQALHAARYKAAEIVPVPEEARRATRLAESLGLPRSRTWRLYEVPEAYAGATTPARA